MNPRTLTRFLGLVLPGLLLMGGLGEGPTPLRAQASEPPSLFVKQCPEPPEVEAYLRSLGVKGDLTNPTASMAVLRMISSECSLPDQASNPLLQSLDRELQSVILRGEDLKQSANAFLNPLWSAYFKGFLRAPMSVPGVTGAPSDHYFPGKPYEVIVENPEKPTLNQQAFLTRWRAVQGVLCSMTNPAVQEQLRYQQAFDKRLTFIREKGFLQYPWEMASNRGGRQENYLVWFHPSLAFTLGPIEGKTFSQLREAARTSIQPTLNVSLLGFIRYPLGEAKGTITDSYTQYWGITLGVMTGPSQASHPNWGPSIEFHYQAYSLGLSRHDTQGGGKQTYLFTTFNLARYVKLP